MTSFATPSDAWFAVIDALVAPDPQGRGLVGQVAPRDQVTWELKGPQTFVVEHPTALPVQADGRDFKHVIGVVEGLSLVGQVSIPEVIVDRVAAFRPFMRRSVFWGAYGPRVAGNVGQVVDLLKRDPDSRQAVLTLFDSDRDLGRVEQVDLPCTVMLQYLIRDGALHSWTVMRSNDAWLGLPYDLMQFGMLQAAIAQALGLPVGRMTHSAGSMHLYARNLAAAFGVRGPIAPEPDLLMWGADDIGEIATRARRILLGQASQLTGLTFFEQFCAEVLA